MENTTEMLSTEQAIEDLSLMLMYLTSFRERDWPEEYTFRRAWKGYDFRVMDSLSEKDFIDQGSHRSKSLYLTEEGIQHAKSLLNKYNIQNDIE